MKKINPKTVFIFQSKNKKQVIASDPTIETITVVTTISKAVPTSPVAKPVIYR